MFCSTKDTKALRRSRAALRRYRATAKVRPRRVDALGAGACGGFVQAMPEFI